MNTLVIVPLISLIGCVALLVLVLSSRKERLRNFLAVALTFAVIRSFGSFMIHANFFAEQAIFWYGCLVVCMSGLIVSYYAFVRVFANKPVGWTTYMGYVIVAVIIILFASGYYARNVYISDGFMHIEENRFAYYFTGAVALFYGAGIFYELVRRYRQLTDPLDRNQAVYLLLGFGIGAFFSTSNIVPSLRGYPIDQVGVFLFCSVITYAIVRHRLLDIHFVMRRVLVFGAMGGLFLGTFALWLFLISTILHVELNFGSVFLIGLLTLFSAAVFWYRTRVLMYEKVDQFVYGESYRSRQDLIEFIRRKVPTVSNLDEFGRELLLLIARALDCRQVYLLLQESGTNDFVVHFVQPEKNVDPSLRIRQDNPILEWLKRENRYLSKENLDVLPEFCGMWAEEKDGLKALHAELLFPMVSRDSLVAILMLDKKESGRYSLDDINLVETITTQIATSLEKEYFQEQLRKREQELAMINRLATIISSSLNIREVYDAFIAELRSVVDIDWATIALIEGDDLRLEVLSTEVGSAWGAGDKIPLIGTGTEWVAKRKKALLEPDLTKSNKFWTGEMHLKQGIRSIVYLPLVAKNETTGSLVIASRHPNAYTPGQIRLLERLASQIAMPVENSRLYARAEQRARVDELTSLFNRRHFDECIKQEIDRHARYRSMLSLILIDLDFFKAYNDTQGHTAGDKILELVGKFINKSIRNTDLAFRYGGDEFAVILPQSATNDTLVVAERVRNRIADEMSKKDIRITASLGLASWPDDGVTTDELVNAADRALYYAKETGGDRTCVASKMLPSLTGDDATRTTTEREVLSTIHALAATIEARDPYTYGHSRKVSSYAVALAEAIGLPSEKVTVISTAALLHDIGKVGVPDEVLNKVGKLEIEAWGLIKSHPTLSMTIVGHVASLVSCLPAILHHHERWDGLGYPDGLKGEAIPVEARVLAVADAFDAMTSSRPYRNKLSWKKVLQELKRCSGIQFDPKLVEAFLPIALSLSPDELSVLEDHSSSKTES
ncbi:MAG: diguanylate cyclase [Dehalococcoidia bacterium]|nr:diguanylate cyclase [Dehalococcoidia bacterium]